MMRPCLAMALLALASTSALAAPTVDDFQTWGNVTLTGSLGKLTGDTALNKWLYWGEWQGRFGDNSSRLSQTIVRPGLGYQISDSLSLWAGYAWVPTGEPFITSSRDLNEQRIWQQLLWKQSFAPGDAQLRTRMEERYTVGSQVGWRFRQLAKYWYNLPFAPDFGIVAADEIFVNLNSVTYGAHNTVALEDGFDQNRAFLGLGYKATKEIRLELGYMNQTISKYNKADRMDNILGINIFMNYF